MTEEQPLKQEKKQQAKKQEDNLGDLAWGITAFAKGIQGLTKQMENRKPKEVDMVKHNQELIESLRQQIEAKKKIREQFNEYKIVLDEYNRLKKEDAANQITKKKKFVIFKKE